MIMGYGAAGDWQTVSLSAALAAIVLTMPFFVCVKESPLGYEEEKKKEAKKTSA
jgi:formate hydrogenlyase subunit 4